MPIRSRPALRFLAGWLLACALGLSLAGCRSTPIASGDEALRGELEQLNQEFLKLGQARERLAVQVISLQREIEDIDRLIKDLEEKEFDVQVRISRLLGQEPPRTGTRSSLGFVVQWVFLALAAVVIFLLFKIRRSRLRDARRLDRLRQVLSQGGDQPEGGGKASASERKG